MSRFIESLAARWELDTEELSDEQPPHVIVAIDYGVLRNRLSHPTREVLLCALGFLKRYPKALLLFANSSHCFSGSEISSFLQKQGLFERRNASRQRILDFGAVKNSVEEALAIREGVTQGMLPHGRILIVCSRFHTRSLRFIYRRVFPKSTLSFSFIPKHKDLDDDSVFWNQHTRTAWLASNVLRQISLHLLGLRITKNLSWSARKA